MRNRKFKAVGYWLRFMVLALIVALLCPAGVLAQDSLTVAVQTAGNQVTIQGTTAADTPVTLLVTKTSNGNKSYIDQLQSTDQGTYEVSFQLADGDYRAKVSSNGLQQEKDFTVSSQTSLLTPPVLSADSSENTVGQALDLSFPDDSAWRNAVSGITVDGSNLSAAQYTFTSGNLHLLTGALTTAGSHTIVVKATGYNDATVSQDLEAAADLGIVKVSVVDEAPRLASEVASLGADYQEPFGVILPLTEVGITEGLTMRGAVKKALATKNITVYGASNYITGIGPITSEDGTRTVARFSEFDGGKNSGWMISLNDWFINAGANTFNVKDGDVVQLCYTCNLGADLGADFNNTDTTLQSLVVSPGTLSPQFSSGIQNYTLTLPAAGSIMVTPTAANKTNQVVIQSGGKTYRGTGEISVADKQVITVTCASNIYQITIAIAGGNQDQAQADQVSALIAALPASGQISLADQAQIEAARTAYNALSEAQKALITNLDKLTAAEAELAQLSAGDTTPPVITVNDLAGQIVSGDLTVSEPDFSFKVTAQDEKDGLLAPSVKFNGSTLVAGSDGTYTCTLSSGSNTITITAADSAGNQAEKTLNVSLGSLAYQKAGIDVEKRMVSLIFNMEIVNNKASLEELKDAVTYAVDGVNYTSLNPLDQVTITQKTLAVTFNTPLTGHNNQLKLAANSLKDSRGKVLSSEVTTEALDAGTLDECFIATAAYGSKYQPDVVLLRQFRDHCLLTNPLGQTFVKFYYRHSPPIANVIAHSGGWLKITVRGMLAPLVVLAYLLLHPVVMIGVLTVVIIGTVELRRRKKNRIKALSLTGK